MKARAAWWPWAVVAALLAYLVTQYGYAWRVPFINDDFAFLDQTRTMRFRDLWAWHGHWVGLYYRPWSRELHYWAFQHLFGAREAPFHLASFTLWLATLLLYFALVRRLAGTRAAGVATAGAAALAAWGLPVVWLAGVQELWMLGLALASLLWFAHGRSAPATLAFVLALLSKETALLLPAVAFVLMVAPGWVKPRRALLRLAPALAVCGIWVAVHPQLGGRWWGGVPAPVAVPGPGPLGALARTLLATVNLHAVPRPEFGWGTPLRVGAAGAACLVALVAVARAAERPDGEPAAGASAGRLEVIAATWACAGWLPLLVPGLGWHAYYGLFGMLGAWLALGTLLARRRALAVVAIVALALLRPLHAATASRDWGDEAYQKRAAEFLHFMRVDLRAKVRAPASHSRFFFVDVPSSVGFLQGDAPALRVWYGDSTLRGGLFSDFRVRDAAGRRGPDRFFRFDSTAGWVEIRAGDENVAAARAADRLWRRDHERLAIALSRGQDWPAAATEYAKLARALPDSVNYVYYAGLAALAAGDSAGGRTWLGRAARLPDADDEIRAAARSAGAMRAPGR
jgi:hypothetical protein